MWLTLHFRNIYLPAMHGLTIVEAYELIVGNYSVVSICNCESLYLDSSSCKVEGRDPVSGEMSIIWHLPNTMYQGEVPEENGPIRRVKVGNILSFTKSYLKKINK